MDGTEEDGEVEDGVEDELELPKTIGVDALFFDRCVAGLLRRAAARVVVASGPLCSPDHAEPLLPALLSGGRLAYRL